MKGNLDRCFRSVLGSEGGFVDLPADPGGATRLGITQRTLAAWRKHPVSVQDVKNLTEDEAIQIYAEQYAAPIRFDDLPSGLDLAVFDASINSGPNRAGRLLQETLGMTGTDVDGIIGAHTLAELSNYPDVSQFIEAYCAARLAFMQSLTNWSTFGKGWTARVRRVQVEARAMVRGRATIEAALSLPPEALAKAGGAVKVTATRSGKAAIVNVVTATAAAVVTAGTAASQASAALQPYGDVRLVRYALLGLAVVSAAGTLVVAMQRAKRGGTT